MTAPHERLRARLGDPALYLDDPADTARYARDWIGKYAGHAPLVVRPRSTEEVAAVLAACTELDVTVVPQAGNTGMVGGSVPRAGEVVLSVERMNAIEAFDEASATVRVQAGVVLETLQNFLAERGYDMPVDLGARGSCQIGGMIATNAGGVKVLRYGHMREQVRGLEVVLADGTVVSGLNILKKNNTGLDLKQVFIGSEGTLGVITRAVLQVQPAPEAFQTALAGLTHRAQLPTLLQAARARFPRLSSLEFVDGATVAYVRNADPDLRIPLDGAHASLVVIEEESSAGEAAGEAFADGLESLLQAGLIADAVVAGSEAQARAIWRVREAPTETVSRRGLTPQVRRHGAARRDSRLPRRDGGTGRGLRGLARRPLRPSRRRQRARQHGAGTGACGRRLPRHGARAGRTRSTAPCMHAKAASAPSTASA